jgi:hypothetical protein
MAALPSQLAKSASTIRKRRALFWFAAKPLRFLLVAAVVAIQLSGYAPVSALFHSHAS